MTSYKGGFPPLRLCGSGLFGDHSDELGTFLYARCSVGTNFREVRRIIIQAPTESDAREALGLRGLLIHVFAKAERPTEEEFAYRPDGTVLVGASKQSERLKVYGPFDDESDARYWISAQSNPDKRTYTIIEPDECLHYQRLDGKLVEIVMPGDLMKGPSGD